MIFLKAYKTLGDTNVSIKSYEENRTRVINDFKMIFQNEEVFSIVFGEYILNLYCLLLEKYDILKNLKEG